MSNPFPRARHTVALTGAGVSAASGVPTFRDALTGLWAKHNPEDLATPEAFARDPALVAAWYEARRAAVEACAPNPAHTALAALEAAAVRRGDRFTLLTQNVDRLHHRAGSAEPHELHGNLFDWRCTTCDHHANRTGAPSLDHADAPPRCEPCNGPMRPGVVWFGEALPLDVMDLAERALRDCDLFLAIGTSGVVYPVAGFVELARDAGAVCIEVNPQPTPLSDRFHHAIRQPADAWLPTLVPA